MTTYSEAVCVFENFKLDLKLLLLVVSGPQDRRKNQTFFAWFQRFIRGES